MVTLQPDARECFTILFNPSCTILNTLISCIGVRRPSIASTCASIRIPDDDAHFFTVASIVRDNAEPLEHVRMEIGGYLTYVLDGRLHGGGDFCNLRSGLRQFGCISAPVQPVS